MTTTALHERLSAAGARLGEYSGAQTPAVFSSPQGELAVLRSRCGVFDLGWRAKLMITGADRVRWMNGMVTNNVRDLAPGRGVYTFLLNPQGHILADMNVYNRGEYLAVDTDVSQAAKLRATFGRYIIMDNVQVTDASDQLTALGLEGPKSGEALGAAGFTVGHLEPMQIEDRVWREVGVSLVRTSQNRYELWLAPAHTEPVWETLVAVGATPVGTEALERWRVLSGIPKYGVDIRERDLPQETKQERALHFSKGCYIGQEIVERIRSRGAVHRMFTGFVFTGNPPAPGTKIEKDGREVGEITSVAMLPAVNGETAVGLGYLRREAGAPGTKLHVGGGEAIVVELPFKID